MAFNPYSNKNGTANYQPKPDTSLVKKEELPEEYVDLAESNVQALKSRHEKQISTTKLRNIFGLFADLYNQTLRTENKQLTKEMQDILRSARVRIIYECGREAATKTFVESVKILEYLASIGNNKDKFIRFYHYMEALVAYARYLKFSKDD